MTTVMLDSVHWCRHHGHPVVMLRTADDRQVLVAIAVEDAVGLAEWWGQPHAETAIRRLHGLLEVTLSRLGAELSAVQLHIGAGQTLRATLHIMGPAGPLALPAYFADGLALACRAAIPLWMTDEDVHRLPPSLAAPDVASTATRSDLPGAFRTLIDSLDLAGFETHEPGASDSADDRP